MIVVILVMIILNMHQADKIND